MYRIKLYAIRSGDVGCPECSVVEIVAEDARNEAIFPIRRENALVLVKPILLYRRLLGGIHIDAQVADGTVASHRAPMDKRRVKLHRLRRRLLVVALRQRSHAISPAVTCIRAEIAQIREHRIVAVAGGGVAHKEVDHIAPLRCPSRRVLLYKSGCVDKVTPMEMMVVDILVLTVACRIAEHRGPVFIVIEQECLLSAGIRQPVFQTLLHEVECPIKDSVVARSFRHMGCLDEAVQQLSVVVGVGPACQAVVCHHFCLKSVELRL